MLTIILVSLSVLYVLRLLFIRSTPASRDLRKE